ncbi:MAG: hypothetical protein IAF38_11530 [Bacteroidia bacterium]|nr:hypothetical protein [Bacteroidia bacterium]
MKKIFCVLFVFGSLVFIPAQNTEMAAKVIKLINEARTKPEKFLADNQTALQNYKPAFVTLLKKSKHLPAVIEDKDLVEMAKNVIEKNDLNPQYKGKNQNCGISSGKNTGTLSKDALYYVCEMYTNVEDKSYLYLGIYFNKAMTGYSFQWGIGCEREKIDYTFAEKIDSSGVDFNKLNTAKNVTYLSDIEKQMIAEVNFARAYPKVYAKLVAKHLNDLSKGIWGLTQDTYDAGIELIKELETQEPRSILKPKECVYKAAKKHGLDCEKRKFSGHTGSDGSDPWDRILKECTDLKIANENLAGNVSVHPRGPVMSLLLDDGISSRGHRYNMLDKRWLYIGCYRYLGKKTEYYTLYEWIQNFAG